MEGTIRNIAVIGHSGEGKTTLVEAILFNAGAIDRQGRVDDGNTVSDFDQEEIARKTSISLSVSRCEYTDRKGRHVAFNLVDVPGFFDFEGESNQALSLRVRAERSPSVPKKLSNIAWRTEFRRYSL